MTVPTTIDAAAWLGKYLEGDDGDPDLARAMLAAFAEALMSAQASMQCGAAYGERSEERENSRNGYRIRPWDTRVGTIDLAVPEAAPGGVLAGVLAPAPPAGRAGPGGGGLPGLRGGGVHPAGRRPGQGHGDRGDLQVRGVPPGRRARHQGGRVPGAPLGRRPLPLPVDRRPRPSGSARAAGW